MTSRRELALDALGKALRLRAQLGVPLTDAVSPIDVAEKIGIQVRFVDLPSMEGIYVSGAEPQILLSTLRPQGRKTFTCAHEIGHHLYGHGDKFDEIRSKPQTPQYDEQEFSADCFAAYFLMPKATIDSALRVRGLSFQALDPETTFRLSSWLGVGYHTLVTHLRVGLGAISKTKARELAEASPQEIRRRILGGLSSKHIHIVDLNWVGRAVDCEVNDFLVIPNDTVFQSVRLKRHSPFLIQATEPGIDRLAALESSWASFVRISPEEYVGRACFRFEEICDENNIDC